ncbi:pulmonary surfactant-associated protein D-like [Spea bombifrons]|uniref:pulmonary surfactant-associated protein D-like n=1 Tax=Spea bombifrons TaxID=233779 RepID=UPI00234B9EA6|nr:pulmonary surfactant-associated protein D-like [Spea bombifrons]
MPHYFKGLIVTFLAALRFSHCDPSETPTCSVVQGLPGLNGRDGRDGVNGQKGDQGLMGQTGPSGLRGINGPPGKVGPPGQTGIQGDKGSTGTQGTKGEKGSSGEKGPPGIKGEMGSPGARGDKGDPDASMAIKVANLENKIADLEKSIAVLRRVCYAHSGVTTLGNKIYVATTQEGNYGNAKALCNSYQGVLPTPLSAAENAAIFKMSKAKTMFLGINDIKNEDAWVDEDGKSTGYRGWEPKEPNGGRNENCVEMTGSGRWNDCVCDRKNTIGCEFRL